jgi:hypothetical protein
MDWPKTIVVRGVAIPVSSWDEIREAITELGQSESVSIQPTTGRSTATPISRLAPPDRHILTQFLASPDRGLRNSDIASAIGAQSGEIGAKLNDWARRIGLTTGDGSAFEGVNLGRGGRGYRLTNLGQGVARTLLEGGG